MGERTTTSVDRGAYPDAVTPWEQETWRDAALDWARRGLAAHGLRETGRRAVRLRPWSVLVRLSVEGTAGAVWFKANPPASAFEGALTGALAAWTPEHVLAPLAVDAERGWSLLPDGGALFRDVLDRVPDDPRAWEEPLRCYAALQRALLPHLPALERLGVPAARTTALPEVFDRLVEDGTTSAPGARARLLALRPRLADWCAELAAVGVPDSLDHADLHAGQVFAPRPGRFTFFDWGDATLSHPFCSLRVPVRAACERYGPEVAPRLRDAYLEPWTGRGTSAAELRRAASLAWRPGALGRAVSFGRLFPGASRAAERACAAASAAALRETADAPPY
ncbi:aminoglycoside phosphotransferase family protein [Streptomyces sp. DSM 42041]|uniref:Aminoglycoside phosphotransferase family protein n=1 Tax=Streptomyces hazeniae TaxID=3075538 RepID=A0ABU2NV15_9ACTN|nr:aminoglycoside phosphotransferase family protein [Streptomyces sp. DSM 42041]MDT0380814.1 aminoglycoside phosphotransferase family protein [Streptomyces sp. DSM 42041]